MPSSTSSSRDVGSRFLPGLRPRRIAHRGLALDGAENTLRAFADALEAGADVLETDAHATADGRAVALHDGDLRRVAGDPRRIHEVPSTQLAAVRVGGSEPVPLLEDVLGAFDAPVNIDTENNSPCGCSYADSGCVARTSRRQSSPCHTPTESPMSVREDWLRRAWTYAHILPLRALRLDGIANDRAFVRERAEDLAVAWPREEDE